jgi:hypothetical protein
MFHLLTKAATAALLNWVADGGKGRVFMQPHPSHPSPIAPVVTIVGVREHAASL